MKVCRYCGSHKVFKVHVSPFSYFGYYHCLNCNTNGVFKDLTIDVGDEEFNKENNNDKIWISSR